MTHLEVLFQLLCVSVDADARLGRHLGLKKAPQRRRHARVGHVEQQAAAAAPLRAVGLGAVSGGGPEWRMGGKEGAIWWAVAQVYNGGKDRAYGIVGKCRLQ